MHFSKGYKAFGILLYAILGACSGGNHAMSPLPTNAGASNALPAERVAKTDLTGTSSQQEQLYVLLENPYNATPQKSYFYRYVFGNSKPAATMPLPNEQFGMFVSPDRYVITEGPSGNGIEANVYGPNGTHTTLTSLNNANVSGANLAMSTDNNVLAMISYELNAGSLQIEEYRAPFTTPFTSATGQDNPNGIYVGLLNHSGSQAFGVYTGSLQSYADMFDVPGTQTITLNTGIWSPLGQEAYDGSHGLLYAYSFSNNNSNVRGIAIADSVHNNYLGYLNVPNGAVANSTPMAVNQATGDLYVAIGNKIYVYNVPGCHCARVLRTLNSPISASEGGSNVVIDAANKHLLLYAGPQYPITPKIFDVNPVTGALQGTYQPPASDVNIQSVVVQ